MREHGSSSRLIALNREMDLLFDAAARHGGYRLIVIDPISAYLDGLDANSNNDVRRLLSRLADLAERSGAAVLLVSHLRKTASHTPAVYRTLGSVAFTAVARALWTVLKDPSDPNRRLMLPIKMNMTAPSLGLGYRIVDPGRVAWDPQPLVADANDRGPDAFADLDRGERSVQARRWLRSVLMKGRLPSSEIKLRAREAGLCRDALWQAKRELGVKAIKPDVRSGWFWELPPPALAPMDEDLLDPFTASLSVPELIQTAQRLG